MCHLYRYFQSSRFIYRDKPNGNELGETADMGQQQPVGKRLHELREDIEGLDTLEEMDSAERDNLLRRLQEEVTPDEFCAAWKEYMKGLGKEPVYEELIDFVWRTNLPENFVVPPESFWSESEQKEHGKASREEILTERKLYFSAYYPFIPYFKLQINLWTRVHPEPREPLINWLPDSRAVLEWQAKYREWEGEKRAYERFLKEQIVDNAQRYPLYFSNEDILDFIKKNIDAEEAKRLRPGHSPENFLVPSESQQKEYEKAHREKIFAERETYFRQGGYPISQVVRDRMNLWERDNPEPPEEQYYNARMHSDDFRKWHKAYDAHVQQLTQHFTDVYVSSSKRYPLHLSSSDIGHLMYNGITSHQAGQWPERFTADSIIWFEREKISPAKATEYPEHFSGYEVIAMLQDRIAPVEITKYAKRFNYEEIIQLLRYRIPPEVANVYYPPRFENVYSIINLHLNNVPLAEAELYPAPFTATDIGVLYKKGITGKLATRYCKELYMPSTYSDVDAPRFYSDWAEHLTWYHRSDSKNRAKMRREDRRAYGN